MDRYSHSHRGDETAALTVFPDLDQDFKAAKANGTDDASVVIINVLGSASDLAFSLAQLGALDETFVDSDGPATRMTIDMAKQQETLESSGNTAELKGFLNGGGGIRTHGKPKPTPVFKTGGLSTYSIEKR